MSDLPLNLEALDRLNIPYQAAQDVPADDGGQMVTLPQAAKPGDICYTGPCIPGTTNREVWFFDANMSCKIKAAVPDHACGA